MTKASSCRTMINRTGSATRKTPSKVVPPPLRASGLDSASYHGSAKPLCASGLDSATYHGTSNTMSSPPIVATSTSVRATDLAPYNNNHNNDILQNSRPREHDLATAAEGLTEIVGYLKRKEDMPHQMVVTNMPPELSEDSLRTMRTIDTTLALHQGLMNRKQLGEDEEADAMASDAMMKESLAPAATKPAGEDLVPMTPRTVKRAFDMAPIAPTRNNSGNTKRVK